jgi:peptide/nickel transport system substrate-binding protein
VREYVYESLLARAPDEPFTLYGLIAGRIEVAADRSSITFHIRPEARFSDGQPITARDVLFSHAVLRDKGWPFHREYYRKAIKAEAPGPLTVRFEFTPVGDREIPLIFGLMPVLPSHLLTPETFDRAGLDIPVGSGPYMLKVVDAGRKLVYRRNPQHWARDLPVNRGRYNFDEIQIEYSREQTALLEAFKAGEIDFRSESDPATWAEGYNFPAAADGRVVVSELATAMPAGLSAIALNTRRPPLDDPRVREALIHAFDFEAINRSLYHGLYVRSPSLFSRSELSAAGVPASAGERALLAPFPEAVAADVMAGSRRLPESDGLGSNRDGLKKASELLRAAGFTIKGPVMVGPDGRPLALELLAASKATERLMLTYAASLRRLGITLTIRQVDSAQFSSRIKTFNFDAVQWIWRSSLSPGNEQANRWSSRQADNQGSQNLTGLKSPAADAAIEALIRAGTREELVDAARALDRVVMSAGVAVPLFHVPKAWIAHWRHLKRPARAPQSGIDLDAWWIER